MNYLWNRFIHNSEISCKSCKKNIQIKILKYLLKLSKESYKLIEFFKDIKGIKDLLYKNQFYNTTDS